MPIRHATLDHRSGYRYSRPIRRVGATIGWLGVIGRFHPCAANFFTFLLNQNKGAAVLYRRSVRFFDPHADIRFTKNRLPHWQQDRAVYFVTFRLADALPTNVLKQWDEQRIAWLKWHPLPWNAEVEREYNKCFSAKMEQWLDTGHGSCILRRQACAHEIATALQHFDGSRVNIISFVIMPNHVHALFGPTTHWPLEKLVQSWKRQSAVRINRLTGSSGVLWQRDYFDRLVRNEEHFWKCIRYIRHNPEKAHLRPGEYILHESDAARAVGEAV